MRHERPALGVLWLIGSIVAWVIGSSLLVSPQVSEREEIFSLSLSFALMGLLVGTVLGVTGWLTLRHFLRSPWIWLAATMVGLPMGLAAGFLANAVSLVTQIHRMGMALSGEGGAATMSPAAPITLVIAGLVLATAQLPFLARGLASNWRKKALWLLGGVAAFGAGWFGSATLIASSGAPTAAQGAVMGAISGAIDILVLWVLDWENRRPSSRSSRLGKLAPGKS